ncbi:hypothetical protein BH747_06405 [Enterococcus villorum]|uniref:Uncharacterized protein n=1 Tax=Enterococcus villorum TaxID=112904 RepID=A0A1V8YCI1_9ENTE|nr:hypothetical protein BH747_06405 [Enterococcus villorum]OQO77214.1 hypothetical protein BH744_00630 [Enterococcus villorum]
MKMLFGFKVFRPYYHFIMYFSIDNWRMDQRFNEGTTHRLMAKSLFYKFLLFGTLCFMVEFRFLMFIAVLLFSFFKKRKRSK